MHFVFDYNRLKDDETRRSYDTFRVGERLSAQSRIVIKSLNHSIHNSPA